MGIVSQVLATQSSLSVVAVHRCEQAYHAR
jgi:hypothetical protein